MSEFFKTPAGLGLLIGAGILLFVQFTLLGAMADIMASGMLFGLGVALGALLRKGK